VENSDEQFIVACHMNQKTTIQMGAKYYIGVSKVVAGSAINNLYVVFTKALSDPLTIQQC
jgi:hypothetical protein